MAEFRMPSLGADMDVGTVVEWLVKPGDEVHRGDIVAVVDTAKAAVEVECFVGGTVQEILVPVGQTVPVGTLLANIRSRGVAEAVPPVVAMQQPTQPVVPQAAPAAVEPARVESPLVRRLAKQLGLDLSKVRGTGPGGTITRRDVQLAATRPLPGPARRPVSPHARKLALELGVDLASVTGTGPGGAIHAGDVRAAAQPVAAPAAAARADAMRRAIAALMARSKREIPHYYLSTTVDMSKVTQWLREHNRDLPVQQRLVPAALLFKATALAIRQVPQINGFWVDGHFAAGSSVHLGVAISLRGGGLVAPAIHDSADRSVDELMAMLRDLVARARAGRLRSSEMSDPTITVTNLGEQGVEAVLGVIYPPQVALVGFGKVVTRPYAVDGLLGIRPVVTLTLSGDHRATDGFIGARFLDAIDKLLQKPEAL
jgi:pyruvate dehydrogenase E2 component (dihydrolipoyllysine-residue acetyltransferase)